MTVKRVPHLFFTILLIMGLMVSCKPAATPTETPSEPEEEVFDPADHTLYMVGILKGHPVIRLFTAGFVVACEELGYNYKLILQDGSDIGKFSQDLEQALAESPDGIVSWAQDPALKPVFARIGEAGIPITSSHFPLEEGEYPGLIAWAAPDNEAYSQNAALAMGEELVRRGHTSGTIAVTQGSFNWLENKIANIFTETMNENFPQFTVLEPQEETFDTPVAIAKAAAIIQANPDIIGALSTTGAGPTTWARAAEETGFADGEIVIISMDYTRPNLDLVQEGKVFGLIGQPLYEEFYEAVYIIDNYLRGEPYEFANLLPAPIITVDDLDYYYGLNDTVEAKLGE
jgi:ribose transport system substrate-binding protein